MKMIRSILPVGQGAFYCERFKLNLDDNNFVNVVYDCGSSNNLKCVEKQIKETFYKDETIQAVFVSHLHSDHINGLEILLKHCNVENIFFPLTQKDDKIIMYLDSLVNGGRISSFTREFIENPRTAIKNLRLDKPTQLFYIKPYNGEDKYVDSDEGEPCFSGEELSKHIFRHNSNKNHPCEWVFIPFNFELNDRKEQLINNLRMYLDSDFEGLEQLYFQWKENVNGARRKIRKAFEMVEGSLNSNSMTLYSGPKQNNGHQQLLITNGQYCRKCFNYQYKNAGCLYTGDYNASKEKTYQELKNKYSTQWENIGCMQIPHHGSIYNYNSEFSKMSAFFVISAGKENQFRHPHSYVINDMILNNKHPFIVTEDVGTAVNFIVKL